MSRLYDVPLTLTELLHPARQPADARRHPQRLGDGQRRAAELDGRRRASSSASRPSPRRPACSMLVTVFGRRWAVIPLLLVYLASPLTLTAYMWWAAAINQVPLHAAFFLTMTCAVQYFRTRRGCGSASRFAGVLLGMAFYVKAVADPPRRRRGGVPLLRAAERRSQRSGGRTSRPRVRASAARTLRAYAPLWAVLAAVGAAYTALYVRTVESPLEGYDVEWASLADNFLRLSLGPALVGGPVAVVEPHRTRRPGGPTVVGGDGDLERGFALDGLLAAPARRGALAGAAHPGGLPRGDLRPAGRGPGVGRRLGGGPRAALPRRRDPGDRAVARAAAARRTPSRGLPA